MQKIGIIGSGIFGTALAITASRAGNKVLCWDRNSEIIDEINQKHINKKYLPNIPLSDSILATTEISEIFAFADIILITVSAQATREIFQKIKPYITQEKIIVLCAKGIEAQSGKLLSEIAQEEIKEATIAILSGPGFAVDIAQNRLTSVTIACNQEGIAEKLSQYLGTPYFRPYTSHDMISPQIGGAIKNVIAIASGIIDGAKLGDGARAALITRGLAEMLRLSKAMGGHSKTMMGMCGLGDLVLTANSSQSRNYSFGYQIGIDGSAEKALKENTRTVEGILTTSAVIKLAKKLNVEMPICQTVNNILFNHMFISEAIKELMSRPYKEEGY